MHSLTATFHPRCILERKRAHVGIHWDQLSVSDLGSGPTLERNEALTLMDWGLFQQKHKRAKRRQSLLLLRLLLPVSGITFLPSKKCRNVLSAAGDRLQCRTNFLLLFRHPPLSLPELALALSPITAAAASIQFRSCVNWWSKPATRDLHIHDDGGKVHRSQCSPHPFTWPFLLRERERIKALSTID